MLSNPRERSRFVRFAIVGAVGAVIDFSIFNLFIQVFHLLSVRASTISFIAAVLSNFIWNRYWTYPDSRSKPMLGQLIQFSVVSVFGLGIRIVLFWLLEDYFISFSKVYITSDFLEPIFVGHNLTLAIAILVVMLWNFFINRFWTYNDIV
jgi:putative flippase GtrA